MIWKGRELYTISDITIALERLRSEKEARAFLTLYIIAERAIGTKDPADLVTTNLRYISTFLGTADASRVRAWMGIEE